jgi:hypothetical protein
MNADDFKKIVRSIVKEELQKQLPALIPQVLTEILAGKSVISRPSIETRQSIPVIEPPKPQKKYSSNPLLNQVLNETTVKIRSETGPLVEFSEKPSISRQALNIKNLEPEALVEYTELNESIEPTVVNIIPTTEEQAKVMGKINRDFRGIMKAIDQKKNGGMIFNNDKVSNSG